MSRCFYEADFLLARDLGLRVLRKVRWNVLGLGSNSVDVDANILVLRRLIDKYFKNLLFVLCLISVHDFASLLRHADGFKAMQKLRKETPNDFTTPRFQKRIILLLVVFRQHNFRDVRVHFHGTGSKLF